MQRPLVLLCAGTRWRPMSLVALVCCLIACAGTTANSALATIPIERIDSKQVSLADYRGQVVLVNFWATWCAPCREELPVLDAFYQQHQQQGFVVLAVNAGEPPAQVRAYLAQAHYTFPVFLDQDGALAAGFGGLRGMPTSFILTREGEIVKQYVGVLTPDLFAEYITPLLPQDAYGRAHDGGE